MSELGLAGGKPAAIPLEFNHKLISIEFDNQVPNDSTTVDKDLKDKRGYQSLVGRLLYLNMKRPDIAFVVQVLIQYMHAPKMSHIEDAFIVVRYIKIAHGLGSFMPASICLHIVTLIGEHVWRPGG